MRNLIVVGCGLAGGGFVGAAIAATVWYYRFSHDRRITDVALPHLSDPYPVQPQRPLTSKTVLAKHLIDGIPSVKKSLVGRLALMKQIEAALCELEADSLTLRRAYEEQLRDPTRALMTRLKGYVYQVEHALSQLPCPKEALGEDERHLLPYLVVAGKTELYKPILGKVFSDGSMSNRLLFAAFLDKLVWEDNRYEGGDVNYGAAVLLEAIKKVVSKSVDPELTPFNRILEEKMAPLLQRLPLADLRDFDSQYDEYRAREWAEKISNLETGEQLLLPVGDPNHATLLLVTRTGDNTAELTHFNTGLGLEQDRRWKQTTKYQTFKTVRQVPLTNLTSVDNWSDLFSAQTQLKSGEVVKKVLDSLGKGGRVIPPSEDSEDYEECQHQGTCGYQCLMALLHHQLVAEGTLGTKEERLAAYKWIKTQLSLPIMESEIPHADQTIQLALKGPVNKLKAEEMMAEIAKDDIRFKKAAEVWRPFLSQVNRDDLASQFLTTTGFLKRYAFLRQVSEIKAREFLAESAHPQPLEESEALAEALFRHHETILERLTQKIQHGIDQSQPPWAAIGGDLAVLIIKSPFPKKEIEFAVKTLHPDNKDYKVALKPLFFVLKNRAPEHIATLIQAYREAGHEVVADVLQQKAAAKRS